MITTPARGSPSGRAAKAASLLPSRASSTRSSWSTEAPARTGIGGTESRSKHIVGAHPSFARMNVDLAGQGVAITGASSGIGEATALACARAGASVALAARRTDRIEALAERITADGGTAVAISADVGDEDQARAFVEQAHERLGRLDVLVNNAGVMLLGPIAGADLDQWRQMVDVNVFGVLYCTHAALPLMLEQGCGHVVNVSSVAGRFARAGSGVYNLTKFGVGAFSEALRQETAQAGLRVTVVEPGAVATELAGHNRPEIREVISNMFAEVEPLTAEDIANAVLYAIGQPPNVAVNGVLVRPAKQTGGGGGRPRRAPRSGRRCGCAAPCCAPPTPSSRRSSRSSSTPSASTARS